MTDLNITALTNSTGMGNLFCVVNQSTDGILLGGFIIAIFFVVLLVLKKWDFEKALLATSWSCFLIALIASAVSCPDGSKLLSVWYALAFLLITGITALYVWSTGGES